jgi:hypothetical protein
VVLLTVHDKYAPEVIAVLAVVVAASIRFANYAHYCAVIRGARRRRRLFSLDAGAIARLPSGVIASGERTSAMRFEPRTSDCS